MSMTLADLGWSAFFSQQLSLEELETFTPARIVEVQRATLSALSEHGPLSLATPPDTPTSGFAVGDWVLADDGLRVVRRLDRQSLLERKAAGHEVKAQLIAANIATLFIVSSCNQDFNPARLERYLVLAESADCQPVVVLTKSDLADPGDYIRQAEALQPMLPVIALNAKDKGAVAALFDWWGKGQTAALLGSSGVGKSTLTNALTGAALETAAIREDDARGRHTTTTRSLHPADGGRWLVDTPGMRELQLLDVSDGIGAVFADIEELATRCKFRNCAHESEPGCAIQAAMADGSLDRDRYARWQKLAREDAINSETVAQSRARHRGLSRMYKNAISDAGDRKGR